MDHRLQRAPIAVLEVSTEGIVLNSDEVGETLIDAVDPAGALVAAASPPSVDDTLLTAFEGESVTETDFEEYFPAPDRWLAVSVVARLVITYHRD